MMATAYLPPPDIRPKAPVSYQGPGNRARDGERPRIHAQSDTVDESDRVDLEIWTPRQRTRPLVCHPGLDRLDLEGLVAIYLALGYAPTELSIRPTGETVQHLAHDANRAALGNRSGMPPTPGDEAP